MVLRRKTTRLGPACLGFALTLLLLVAATARVSAATTETTLTLDGGSRSVQALLQEVIDATDSDDDDESADAVTLLQRVQNQQRELQRALRSRAYYDGKVEITFAGVPLDDPALLETLEEAPADQKIPVTVAVTTGERYLIRSIDLLQGEAGGAFTLPIDREVLRARVDRPGNSAAILATDDQLVRQMQAQGYPFARVISREAVVDHADHSMHLTWKLEPGPKAPFGVVRYGGLERTREKFLARREPFEPGEAFTPEKLDALRDDLIALGIFSSVRVVKVEELDEEGRMPVSVELKERAPRSIGFGVDYTTSEGFGFKGYWRHRNLFGGAESLRLSAEVTQVLENTLIDTGFGLFADFRKPDFLARRQDLTAGLFAQRLILDAYTKQAVGGTVGLERLLSRTVKANAGLSLERSLLERNGQKDRFFLLGLPVGVAIDRSNDLLNPTRGFRASASVTPYIDLVDRNTRFISNKLAGSAYLDLSENGRTVLAGRAGFGTLIDLGTSRLPIDKRLYAGGGGSVRGYAFQSLGPRDSSRDPLGGRSALELSLELRQRIAGRFGVVAFVDAGNAYEKAMPDLGEGLRYGAGLGGRYYTDFGPIRLDVAVPLNRRKGDSAYALYVSLGQSF